MTILNPFAWGLLLPAVPVILFFFIKIRFRQEKSATNIFWQQVFEERRFRIIHRRFRLFASLFSALLFLSLLTAAALNPVLSEQQTDRRIFILDRTVSMNARNRLNEAKQQMQQCVRRFSGSETAVLTAENPPQIVSGFSSRTGTLRRKIAGIAPPDSVRTDSGNLTAAVRLAEQLAAGGESVPVYIFTDGCSADAGTLSGEILAKKKNIRFVQIGSPAENTAITRFQSRRLPENPADYEILAEAVHFGSHAVKTRLVVELNGNIIDAVPLVLEPDKPVSAVLRGASSGGGTLRASLEIVHAETEDALPADNFAGCVLPDLPKQTVFLYGKENFFLQKVLQSQPLTDVQVIREIPDSLPPESVLVLHQSVPQKLPQGNIFVIDPHSGCDFFQIGKLPATPVVVRTAAESPLLRYVYLQGAVIPGAREIVTKSKMPEMLAQSADDRPIYALFGSATQKVLVLTADLNQGDLTLRAAFPVLIGNALAFFRGDTGFQAAAGVPASAYDLRAAKLPEREDDSAALSCPIWRYAVFAALILSLTEWCLCQRRRLE